MGQQNGRYVLDNKDVQWFANSTEMTEDDVVERYERFVKHHPTGTIPKTEFISMLQSSYKASKRKSKMQALGFENYTYKTYDVNGDGCIDFKEFLWVMYTLSDETPRHKLELIFKTFDTNRDGFLYHDDVKKVVKDFFLLLSKFKQIEYDIQICYILHLILE